MKLTKHNYFSLENQKTYMGASQFKDFLKCPTRAMAIINGLYEEESTDAFTQGSYLDAYFEHTLDKFQEQHPEMFKKDGSLLLKYEKINELSQIIEADKLMKSKCTGRQQVVMTGEIAGVPFKIMIDSLKKDAIVDRKVMAGFKDKYIDGEWMPWWKAYGYHYQAAIYTEIARQNGKELPFELVAISKEKTPDKAFVRFTKQTIDNALDEIKYYAPTFQAIKDGLIEPTACGQCDWCRINKKLIDTLEEVENGKINTLENRKRK